MQRTEFSIERTCMTALLLVGLLVAARGASDRASADEAKQISYGRHLAQECSACHRLDGVDNGIPSITGWKPELFQETMEYYRTGARPNQVMMSVVQSLDEAQIKALASYYTTIPRPLKTR